MRLTEVPTCEGCIETVELEIGQRHPAPSDPPTDADLRYAADARCVCGAGLAYFKASRLDRNEPGYDSWVCSAAIKKQLPPINEDPHVGKHKLLPFSFYEVKSEDQPSAGGRSTRPKGGNA